MICRCFQIKCDTYVYTIPSKTMTPPKAVTHNLLFVLFLSQIKRYSCVNSLFSIRTAAACSIYNSINLFSSWLTTSSRRHTHSYAEYHMKKSVLSWAPCVDFESQSVFMFLLVAFFVAYYSVLVTRKNFKTIFRIVIDAPY